MSVLQFDALPLPHFIHCGYSLAGAGRKHPERTAVGEFDLIVVKQGCLYVGEEDRRYEVAEGHALILRPDLHHYPTAGTRETTASYWLHFHTAGEWRAETGGEADVVRAERLARGEEAQPDARAEQEDRRAERPTADGEAASAPTFRMTSFGIRLPQFTRLAEPAHMYEALRQLTALESVSHLDAVRWKQQRIFQDVLGLLAESLEAQRPKPGEEVADRAASFLRLNYREPVTAAEIGQALSFHPVYVARCMRQRFGCSPMEYLLRYRLEQAKRLLLQTDLPVHRVARETGFQQAAYFTSCFRKFEGLTPRAYRMIFHRKG
ncbi:AraC family transcriptional regulator [Cohnella sp. REN36]|uniref:helix-turn-helix transcriptional regulator n=1 Tax=Cohnella sp. REN36 TaxID=2887347 RepID=UPI001D13B01E|nr:AraC family transcriptional regulator [Cohnella sp. REN36]MCC3377429.1 AraC family transcriptional regulator [Cohnella sp. REN36]